MDYRLRNESEFYEISVVLSRIKRLAGELLSLFREKSRCRQRADSGEPCFTAFSRLPQIHRCLCIQPELGRIPEKPRQTQHHYGCNRPLLVQQFIDPTI
jgi:hypothetical protein